MSFFHDKQSSKTALHSARPMPPIIIFRGFDPMPSGHQFDTLPAVFAVMSAPLRA
jgi:hypothetical protein